MYKDCFNDVMIADGEMEPPGNTDKEREQAWLAAWQRLINSGLCWQLQGWFGRTAEVLIEMGYCKEAEK